MTLPKRRHSIWQGIQWKKVFAEAPWFALYMLVIACTGIAFHDDPASLGQQIAEAVR